MDLLPVKKKKKKFIMINKIILLNNGICIEFYMLIVKLNYMILNIQMVNKHFGILVLIFWVKLLKTLMEPIYVLDPHYQTDFTMTPLLEKKSFILMIIKL